MSASKLRSLTLSIGLCGLLGTLACESSSPGTGQQTGAAGTGTLAGGAGTSGGAGTGQAGDTGGAGSGQAGTGAGTAGTTGAAGSGAAGVATGLAGAGAAGTTGAAGMTGAAGAAGTMGAAGGGAAGAGAAGTTGAAGSGVEPGDTPPWRALKVTAMPGLHVHGNAGVDTRAKSLGKLAVNLGVSGGGYSSWLGKRGYHSMGSSFGSCPAPNLGAGRDAVGTCRLGEFNMVAAQVKSSLTSLSTQFPDEDWGYFLNQDGTVRWSDVAFFGVSHGATTAALIGRIGVRVWRAVSSAGPRDNTCGKGPFSLPFDPVKPPYDPACPDSNVAAWLDMPSKTPMERFYSIDGVTDGQYGDIQFNIERTKYPGKPVQFDVAGAVLTGTNRFVSQGGGHLDFVGVADNVKPMNTDKVLNIAFGIPPENQNPTF